MRGRTHGREFFAGLRRRECLSRFSVHFFRQEFSKQNGVGFHRLRAPSSGILAASDWNGHPAHFPLCFRILLRKLRRKRSTEKRDRHSRRRSPAKNSRPCCVWRKDAVWLYLDTIAILWVLCFLMPGGKQAWNDLSSICTYYYRRYIPKRDWILMSEN